MSSWDDAKIDAKSDDSYDGSLSINNNELPNARSHFGICNSNDTVYIFGGECDSRPMNDLWKYNSMSICMY